MIFRYLTQNEKLFALSRLRELGRLDHLIPAATPASIVSYHVSKTRVVGGFDGEMLRLIYWTYWADATLKLRYVAIAALVDFDRPMLRDMLHGIRHLTREWDLYGEIDADNVLGAKLAGLCGFNVVGRSDDKIIVKYERSLNHE